MLKKVKCPVCHHTFMATSSGSKYCSQACRIKVYRKRIAESNRRASQKRKEDRRRMERDGIMDKRITKVRKPLTNSRYPDGNMTAEQEADVRRIMRLKPENRWKAGAKDWGHLEQSLARSIERANRSLYFEGACK